MIYKNSYFAKELRQSYIESKISYKKMNAFGVFLGLFSFALHFVLQTMYESVLTQTFPEFMQPSYFSVAYTYTLVSFVFFIVYFIVNYRYLTFNEIYHNKWYALQKMGYSPLNLIMSKIAAVLFSMMIIYTSGFVVTVLMTAFLKYFFVFDYLPTLYLAGFIDILVIVFLTMSASVFIRQRSNARYFVIASALLMFSLKLGSKYYWIVSDRILTQSVSNLFSITQSFYMPLILGILFICFVICIFGARRTAKYYRGIQGPGVELVIRDFKTGKIVVAREEKGRGIYRVLDFATNLVLIVFILLSLTFNGLVLAVSVATPEREISIKGTIPYVFQSITMEPTIEKNDLAFFKKVDRQHPLKKGDIVLFKDKGMVYVERIIDSQEDKLTVDIDYYPPMSDRGAMIKHIERNAVYGLYYDRNRWLGALILFANTIFGRIIFLLIPSVLIFFYKPIMNLAKKLR